MQALFQLSYIPGKVNDGADTWQCVSIDRRMHSCIHGGSCAIRTHGPLSQPRLSKPSSWASRPTIQRNFRLRVPATPNCCVRFPREGDLHHPVPLFVWSVLQVSNLRPHAPKASALPTAPSTVEIFHPNDGVPWKFRNSDLSVIDRVLCL